MVFKIAAILGAGSIVASSLAFDTKWHMDATRIGMTSNGFSSDARLMAQVGNYLTDFASAVDYNDAYRAMGGSGAPAGWPVGILGCDHADVSRLHFDALTTEAQVEHQWKTLEANTVAALKKWNKDPSVKSGYRGILVLTILGASLHAVQDFYSHSNWLKKAGTGYPIWFDVPAETRKHLDVRTGWYPDGNSPGVLYHQEENKDSTGRLMNSQAFDAASRASVDWVKRIVAQVPEVPWATVRAWKPQPENVAGPWLRNADATFITSTSTIAGHWDGPTPVKNVFAVEKSRNRNMAIAALGLSLGVYRTNMGLGSSATPTPFWVGFTMYHIERDLAKGLYLQNRMR